VSNEQGFTVRSQSRILLQSDSLYSSAACTFKTSCFQHSLASKHEGHHFSHWMQYWQNSKIVMCSWYYDWAQKYKNYIRQDRHNS